MSALPPCFNCGAELEVVPNDLGPLFRCSNFCDNDGPMVASPMVWSKLAAPRPLPATVRAVLETRSALRDAWGEPGKEDRDKRLITRLTLEAADAEDAWIAAGRPGMEP